MVVYTGVAMSAGFDDPEQHPTLIIKHKHTFSSASAHFHVTICPWKDWTGYAPSRFVGSATQYILLPTMHFYCAQIHIAMRIYVCWQRKLENSNFLLLPVLPRIPMPGRLANSGNAC